MTWFPGKRSPFRSRDTLGHGFPGSKDRVLLKYPNGNYVRPGEAFQFGSSFDTGTWSPSGSLRKSGLLAPNGMPYYQVNGPRTNLIPYSSDFGQWAVFGTPTRTGSQASPDGTQASILGDDNGAGHEGFESAFSVTGSTQYVSSMWIKKDSDTSRYPGIIFSDTDFNNLARVAINTQTGEVFNNGTVGSLTSIASGSISVDGWWLLWMRATTAAGMTGGKFRIYPALGSSPTGVEQAAVGSVTCWNAQVETGAWPSLPIRTSGAAGTRPVEVFTFPNGSYERFINAPRVAFYWKPWPSSTNLTSAAIWSIQAAPSNNYMLDFNGGRLRLVQTGIEVKVQSNALTFSAVSNDILIVVDRNGTMEISGASSGDGITTGKAFTLPNGVPMYIGYGVFAENCWGFLTEPFIP